MISVAWGRAQVVALNGFWQWWAGRRGWRPIVSAVVGQAQHVSLILAVA